MDYLKVFISKLQNLDRSKRTEQVFKDFLILCICSLAQPFYKSDELEKRYLDTVKNYTKEQAEEFSNLFAFLVNMLEKEFQDFLGQVYMDLNLSNNANGQFWTLYPVSKCMCEINFSEVQNIADKEVITLSEPCCGSGGIIIAFAETMKQHGYNYQKMLFVEAIYIDEIYSVLLPEWYGKKITEKSKGY